MSNNKQAKSSKTTVQEKAKILNQIIENSTPSASNGREAPTGREVVSFGKTVQSVVNEAQFKIINGKTPEWAIQYREGPGGTLLAYIPHGYVRDQLNKAFGGDWDWTLDPAFNGMPFYLSMREETNKKGEVSVKEYLTVIGRLTIRVHDPSDIKKVLTTIVKTGVGSSMLNKGVEFGDSLKSADSDALKRAGLALGIGLDLYYSEEASITRHEEYAKKAENREKEAAEAKEAIFQAPPKSLPELLVRVNERWHVTAADLAPKVGVEDMMQLMALFNADAPALWEKVKAALTKPV